MYNKNVAVQAYVVKLTHIAVTIQPSRDKTNKMACAPSKDTDQTGHPPSLIRVFAVRMKKAWVLSYPLSAQWRLWSEWADAQADLSLCLAHMPCCWFCHEMVHIHCVVLHALILTNLLIPESLLMAVKKWNGKIDKISHIQSFIVGHYYIQKSLPMRQKKILCVIFKSKMHTGTAKNSN